MTRKTISFTVIIVAVAIAAAMFIYSSTASLQAADTEPSAEDRENRLERSYSPSFGPQDAPVTIVEFFDPSCEACRAFYPIVKRILAENPNDVRLVLRYTPFHKGSEEVVRLLEAARLQGVFKSVLEAVLAAQPEWAAHGRPRLDKAWVAAEAAGLDVETARQSMIRPDIDATINQDKEDVAALGIMKTPTFFVNGQPLPSFGVQQLKDLVREEIASSN
ncbi:thioredoxin domain-containing protein [Halomonas sp. McH1-25]|uniref:DsbA family protein n=1 Tax=unclassified Halomonas TaxID=2609666 RepID=UPI001EF4E3BE|nr:MULTISPECIES: thioredoxin domain-containing protein [unclassified Halomonas]MCG7601824.1 thioredoxin domain-containing protein [Halomonas sp. McH1-25]MCP1343889.1 thioredoxin domain-containing protein [Halomonas sp. FL8]MCP1362004.1 thioredoxin domain-containing protein [Halomonas sp. BBD45]MCP1363802.1 thioredoxin domain-containing protein [Halomonas sp. BBD48]